MINRIGAASTAYFGGRSESRIRRVPLPVRYIDFTSMYPTVFSLGRLWTWVVADHFAIEDATANARRFLAGVDRQSLHDPERWAQLAMVFCQVRPSGALLPTRARYTEDAGAWTIGINHLDSPHGLWFTLADLVSAKLLGGATPPVMEAFRIAPVDRLPDLRAVKLRSTLRVKPTDDLLRLAIEERQRVRKGSGRLADFLKTFANGGYGIFAEYRLGQPVTAGVRVHAHGLWPIETRVHTPEEPGELSFPPLAATITGLARLLLALLQIDVEARGGTYMACDTDSLLVVAARTDGLEPCPGGPQRLPDGRPAVRVLSDAELDEVLGEIESLNPYAAGTVEALVKLEDENFPAGGSGNRVELRALAISPKRYVLYEVGPDGPIIRKPSLHGLGMYRPPVPNPPDWSAQWPYWIELVWDSIIRDAEGMPPLEEPEWYALPAVSQLTVTSPALLAPFRSINAGKRYRDQFKPFSFMLIGHVDPLVPLPDGLLLEQLTPIAPYTTRAEELLAQPWVNRHDGRPLAVTTAPAGAKGAVKLKTYRDVIRDYRTHPDAKSGDPAGGQGHRGSRGLLPRLHVRATEIRHIGKESNRLDEEEEGAALAANDVYVEYRDERREWEAMVPALLTLQANVGWRCLAAASGLSERALRYALREGRLPHKDARDALVGLARTSGR